MPEPRIGTRDEFDAARAQLPIREKELTRLSDELARVRRELPRVRVASGRNEGPEFQVWIHRHDEYGDSGGGA